MRTRRVPINAIPLRPRCWRLSVRVSPRHQARATAGLPGPYRVRPMRERGDFFRRCCCAAQISAQFRCSGSALADIFDDSPIAGGDLLWRAAAACVGQHSVGWQGMCGDKYLIAIIGMF